MGLQTISDTFSDFAEEKGFKPKPSIGLLSPAFPNEFNFSAGHDYSLEIFNEEKPLRNPVRYALIDQCFRRIDLDIIGHSDYHLSLFQIALFSYGVCSEYFGEVIGDAISVYLELLSRVLGIPEENLVITIFDGWKEKNISSDDGHLLAEAFTIGGIPKKQILPIAGRRNFFLAQNSKCAGPTCEIFFKMDDTKGGRYVEIGSVNLYKHRNEYEVLNKTTNLVLLAGIGIERTLVALQQVPSVFHTDCIEPLIKVVAEGLNQSLENQIYYPSIRNIVDAYRSAAFICSEGIKSDKTSRGRILGRLIKKGRSQCRYLGINPRFLESFVDTLENIYGRMFPKLAAQKTFILDNLMNYMGGIEQ